MRWFVIGVVALLVAAVVGVAVLDHFEFIDAGALMMEGLKRIRVFRPYVRTYELGLKNSEALARERTKLEDAGQALRLREEEIAKAAQELEARRQASEGELAQLEQRRDLLLQEMQAAERVDKVAKVCAEMSAANAARLLGELPDPDIARVLVKLSDKQVGAILGLFDPRRAARILGYLVQP